MKRTRLGVLLALALVPAGSTFAAPPADGVKEAGQDVPVPKKTKQVLPKYPPEALARGERGLVILDLIIDEEGKVADLKVLHGDPLFGNAAMEAARQWRFEPTRLGGRAVRVHMTMPLSFAVKLPEIVRATGIPELRQGIPAQSPADDVHGGAVIAHVEIDDEGRVVRTTVTQGEPPFTDALLAAVQTWRFMTPDDGRALGFDLHADFKGRSGAVVLSLADPRPVGGDAAAPPAVVASASTQSQPAGAAPAAPPSVAANAAADTGAGAAKRAEPTPLPTSVVPQKPGDMTPPPVGAPPVGAAATAPPAIVNTPAPRAKPAPPPVEVVNAPAEHMPAPAPAGAPAAVVPENGASTIRNVELAPGIPDLVKGHHPVAPPLARMAGTEGDVVVRFSIDSGGISSVASIEGPDLLKEAGEALVRSWSFRRTSPHRVYAVASIHFGLDTSSARVQVAN